MQNKLMKKKFLFVFLAIIVALPVVLLTACSEPTKHTFTFKTSSQELGRVSCASQTSEGTITIAEGQQVTLVATVNENSPSAGSANSHFAGWVYQNSVLLADGAAGYKIENTTNENDIVIKSVLTFSSTTDRQGQYTAVFAGGNTQFVKFSSFYATTDINSQPTTENQNAAALMNAQIEVKQGENELQQVYSSGEITLNENVLVVPENISYVLRLAPDEKRYFRATATMAIADTVLPEKNLNADLTFGQNTQTSTTSDVSSQVIYNENTYKLIFSFMHNQQTYYLVFIYETLS